MGSDVMIYKDRNARFSDWDLFTLRHFLVEESASFDPKDSDAAALHEYVKNWEWWGPGVVSNMQPEPFIGESERRKQLFVEVLSKASERIKKFGAEIPLEYLEIHLNRTNRCGARFLVAQPTDQFVSMIEEIRKLIIG
jgi:hypothetical protein